MNKFVYFLNKCVNYITYRQKLNHWRCEDKSQTALVELPDLTDAEYAELKATWPFLRFSKNDLYWARLYKKEYGFSPYFISSVNQCYQLRSLTNPASQVSSLEHKALVDVYFPGIPFPEVYVRGINGVLYDREMQVLSMEEAVKVLKEKGSFVIKPAFGSMCGKGVRRFNAEEVRDASAEMFEKVFRESTKNFVAQEVLSQHPDIERLNPSSLNCCRITTVLINGHFSFGALLKIGKSGSRIDNWNSGYLVGINEDGSLKAKGWDSRIQPVEETDNGYKFKGLNYPCFSIMLDAVRSYHRQYFPQCGIVGWDVLIDRDGKTRVIEANLLIPGIPAEQLCSGPFFEPVHEELLKLYNHK